MYEFEKWDPRTSVDHPAVTMLPSGLLNFEKSVAQAFKIWGAKSAILFFDRTNKRIGIRLSANIASGHVRVRRHRRSASIKSRKFIAYWGIACPPGERRYSCHYDPAQKMVIVELEKPIPAHRRNGS